MNSKILGTESIATPSLFVKNHLAGPRSPKCTYGAMAATGPKLRQNAAICCRSPMTASWKSKMWTGRLTIAVIHRSPQGAKNRPQVSKYDCGGVFSAAACTATGLNKKRPRRVFSAKQQCRQRILFLGSRFCRFLWRCSFRGILCLWSYRRRGHRNNFQRSTLITQGLDFRIDFVFAFGQLRDACAKFCNGLGCLRNGSLFYRCFGNGFHHFRRSRYLLWSCFSLWSRFFRSCHF